MAVLTLVLCTVLALLSAAWVFTAVRYRRAGGAAAARAGWFFAAGYAALLLQLVFFAPGVRP